MAIILVIVFGRGGEVLQPTQPAGEQTPPAVDPIDVVLDFYNPWLDARLSTTTNPYDAGLAESSVLGTAAQLYLADNRESEVEPVLCQTVLPERVGAKPLFQQDFSAQVQVLSRGLPEKSPNYAVVSLTAVDGEWQISEIMCQSGESAPEREFSFEQTGQLLKSVPAPYNSEYWHLVFLTPGQPAGVVPLFFSAESTCVSADEIETTCNPEQFAETTKVTVQGQMTEAGAEVRYVRF
ncbi:hypothetical protein CL655_01000 [bacterium]|nr:hypothetical protein [bacterium]